MDANRIFESIVEWEMDKGESFVDYFSSDINSLTYMSWCLGRRYISLKKYNMWARAYCDNILDADDPNYYVYSDDESVPFAVVISEEWNEESQKLAYKILSEFISEIDVYTKRLIEFYESN